VSGERAASPERPAEPGIWRIKLDLIVRAPDVDDAIKSLSMKCNALRIQGWEWSEIRSREGRVNPAWRVTQKGDTITVELKRKRRPR
jgi:hypothetical protein